MPPGKPEETELIANLIRRPHLLIATGVFVLTLGLYMATLGPTSDFWDCGEFITTSHIVGVPHQPGTPLYVLMGRVFDVVLGNADITQPALRTAWAVNFMSAFFSALAVTFIFLVIRDIARRADPDAGWLAEVGGVVGALFLAFSETYWNNAVEAEVYGLSAFMIAILTWLSLRWYDYREQRASSNLLLLLIYLLGLGVGFHLGSILVYPGVFLLALLASRRYLPLFDLFLMSVGLFIFLISTSTRDTGLVVMLLIAYGVVVVVRSFQGRHFALVGSALFFVGLTVHVMMLIRAGADPEPLINQTDPDTFATLMSVVRREQYPPLNPFERRAPLMWQYGYYYGFLFKQFYILGPGQGMLTAATTVLGPVFLALVGLFHGLRRVRPLIFVPLVGYVINGELLTLYLNFTNSEVRDRDYFYFAAFMFFAIFIGLGAAALLRYLAGGEGRSAAQIEAAAEDWRAEPRTAAGLPVKAAAVVLLLLALLPITPGHTKYFEHDRHDNRIGYEYAWNILAGLDEGAILFTNGDNDTFPLWYLQMVEHFRTDVTVVNLSLVNLPWYVKQLRRNYGLDMARSDAEIDELRHRWYEDPGTGQRQLIMIKDYVLHDIIAVNAGRLNRPVFFAVTIPEENMQRYWSKLRMEGMAYRLTTTDGPDNQNTVDAQLVLENVLGVYKLGALQRGDPEARRRAYAAMSGRASDTGEIQLGRRGQELPIAALDSLARMIGENRTDVYRGPNARHLLGNYPTALNRAGYEFWQLAEAAAVADTTRFHEYLGRALVAMEASLKMDPYNTIAAETYPLLLIQAYRDDDAKRFLDSLVGAVPVEVEERIVYNTLRSIMRGGLVDLALDWVGAALTREPERKFYYEVQFNLFEVLGRRSEAEAVMEAWAMRSGERDPQMVQALDEMRRRALESEDARIRDAVGDVHDQ